MTLLNSFTPSPASYSKQRDKHEFKFLALPQNSIQNQPHIHPLLATLPGSGQNKNTVNFTGEHARENGDNYGEDGL